jgi:hypothetical protein
VVAEVAIRVPDQVVVPIVVHRLGFSSRIGRLNAKQAADSTDDAANRNPDNSADRSGGLGPHCGAMGGTIWNALGMSRNRGGQ